MKPDELIDHLVQQCIMSLVNSLCMVYYPALDPEVELLIKGEG